MNDVTHVIQYNLPDEIENYTHRSGRTARAGKSGVSIAIIHMKELYKIRQIEKQMNCKFKQARVPEGKEICDKQLMHLAKRVHDVEINEKEIEKFLPAIHEELKELDRDDLIKRFFSIEFNRFLEYYKKTPDLNVDVSQRDRNLDREPRNNRDRDSRGGGDRGSRASYGSSSGTRLFINVGAKDGLDKSRMLRFLCDTSGEKGTIFGRIDVKDTFSFVDVEPDRMKVIMDSINGSTYSGRNVRVEISGEAPAGGRERNGDGGGERRSFSKGSSSGRSDKYSSPGNFKPRERSAAANSERSKSSWEGLMVEEEGKEKKSRRNKFKK